MRSWELELARDGERRVIRAKSVIGNPAIFLKLKIPSDRIERAARIEIRHDDLEATFENAWSFLRQHPRPPDGLDHHRLGAAAFSAFVGDGTPPTGLAVQNRKFGQAAGVRLFKGFPPRFLRTGSKSPPRPARPLLSAGEIAKARALFRRYYGGSFTIDNPIAGARLSVLPQSDQAVFEFGTDSRSGFGYGYSPFSEEEIHFWSRSPDQLLCLYSPDIREGNERRMFLTMGKKKIGGEGGGGGGGGESISSAATSIWIFSPTAVSFPPWPASGWKLPLRGVDNLRFDFHSALDVLKVYDASRRGLTSSPKTR